MTADDSRETRIEPDEEASHGPLARRQYLQLVGLAGLLGVGSMTVGATQDGQTVDVPDEDDWEDTADERIEEHRTGELEVVVQDINRNPLPDADVSIEMQEHAYGFGTAVNADELINGTEDGDEYREYITDLFNTAVLENQHKWRFWESNQDLADEATEWLLDNGFSVRGHACVWANVDAWAVPPDVVEAMGIEWSAGGATDPELDPDHVRERSFEHLEEIISHYGDDIEQWDVVNEVVHEPEMIEVIDGEDVDPVEAPVLAEWYQTAAEVAPDSVALDVNDYNTLEGPYEGTRDDYVRQIEFLLEEEVGLDGIGLQCHFSESETLSPAEIVDGLNRYAELGAEVRITEFDMSDENWDEDDKAVWFRQFLKTAFSHPATTDFLMWGIWDEIHWRDDAPLFYDDWTPKPTYEVYTDLVFDEWWTDESGTTDDDGTFTTSAFLGEHEVTASYGDSTNTATAKVTADGERVEVTLGVDADEVTDDEEDDTETDDDGGDDGLPGFGLVPGLAALAGAAGYALFTRDDDDEH